jgi:hypothetical protein
VSTTTDSSTSSNTDTDPSLSERLHVSDVAVSVAVKAGVRNWRIWGSSSLKVAPVYTAALANGQSLVCLTSASGGSIKAHVAQLASDDSLIQVHELGSDVECRGMAAQSDGSFGVLLWNEGAQSIRLSRYDATAVLLGSTTLANADNKATDFGIGDSRVDAGGGKYGAYYHVHSNDGHEGDTLKWVNAASGSETTGWTWGCSHSMSNALRYNTAHNAFLSACATDCYPGTNGDFATQSIGGIYLERSTKVMDFDGACNGKVAAEVGSAAPADSGWKMVFNGHQNPASKGQNSYNPATMNQDIGWTSIGADKKAGAIVWLTSTPGTNEADASVARWKPAGASKESFVVGWMEQGNNKYYLQEVDGSGKAVSAAEDITGKARWGLRDDPFRQAANGDIIWAWFDSAGSSTLHFARIRASK